MEFIDKVLKLVGVISLIIAVLIVILVVFFQPERPFEIGPIKFGAAGSAPSEVQVDSASFINGTWQVDIKYEVLYGVKVEAIGLGEALMYYNPETKTANSIGYTEVENGLLVNPTTGEKELFDLMMSWEVPDISFGEGFEQIHFTTRVYSACTDNQLMKDSVASTVDIRTGGTLNRVEQGTALKYTGKMGQVDRHGLDAVVTITKIAM